MEEHGNPIREPQGKPKVTIFYDGVCNLCVGLAGKIIASKSGSSFALTDVSEGVLPEGVSMKEALHDVHAIDKNGRMYRGADAVLRILQEYPRMQWLATIGALPGPRQFLMLLYRIIAMTRYRIFGRKS